MKKWFENFWYYYKWPAIVISIVLICVLIGLHAVGGTSEPDLQVLFIGEEGGQLEVGTEMMSGAVEDILSDRNGDGKIQLAYRELPITGEMDNDVSMLHHLVADFASAESQVYLAEKDYLHHFTDQEVLRVLDHLVEERHFEDGYFDADGNLVAVKVINRELLDKMGLYVNEDTYLALRVESEENKNAESLFKALLN